MRTPAARARHRRCGLRCQTGLTDAERGVVSPFFPEAHGVGRPCKWPLRELLGAVFHVLRTGCPWRPIPGGFPPGSAAWNWFRTPRDDGLLTVGITPASVQDRDAAGPLVAASRGRFPFVDLVHADAGCQGPRARNACPVPLEIARGVRGRRVFVVQPRRWAAERTSAWLGRNRRFWRDAETATASATASAEAFLHAPAAVLLIRRPGRAR